MCEMYVQHLYIYIYIYTKKTENQIILNVIDLSIMVKSMLKNFDFIKISSEIYDEEENVCLNNDGCFYKIPEEEKV